MGWLECHEQRILQWKFQFLDSSKSIKLQIHNFVPVNGTYMLPLCHWVFVLDNYKWFCESCSLKSNSSPHIYWRRIQKDKCLKNEICGKCRLLLQTLRSVTSNVNNTVTKINFHILKDFCKKSALINNIHIFSIPPIARMYNILF